MMAVNINGGDDGRGFIKENIDNNASKNMTDGAFVGHNGGHNDAVGINVNINGGVIMDRPRAIIVLYRAVKK